MRLACPPGIALTTPHSPTRDVPAESLNTADRHDTHSSESHPVGETAVDDDLSKTVYNLGQLLVEETAVDDDLLKTVYDLERLLLDETAVDDDTSKVVYNLQQLLM